MQILSSFLSLIASSSEGVGATRQNSRRYLKLGMLAIALLLIPISLGYKSKFQTADRYSAASQLKLAYSSQVLSDMAVHSAEAGQYDRALQVAKSIPNQLIEAKTISAIVSQSVKAGLGKNSPSLLAETLKMAETIPDDWYKAEAFSEIAVQYAEVGQYERALQIAESLKEGYLQDRSLSQIAGQYAKAGQADKALKVAQTIASGTFKASVFSEIAGQYVKAGQQKKATELLTQALQLAQKQPDSFSKVNALQAIAGQYEAVKQVQKATQLIVQSEKIERTVNDRFSKERKIVDFRF